MTQEAIVLRAALKRVSIVVTSVVVLLSSSSVALASECTPFGCHPKQGNPIEELGGQIVMAIFVVALLLGGARRYVK